MTDLYLSTGGTRHKPASAVARDFYNLGVRFVELSGGAYSPDYMAELLELPVELKLRAHNYFPPPKNPFVFNLASENVDVLSRSIEQINLAINLAKKIGDNTYSFHAGFRINPRVDELGKQISRSNLVNREIAKRLFKERVLQVAESARVHGIQILIENNVINAENFKKFGEDPLLLTHPDEISDFMSEMPENVGLLLDVAHLKVSAKTLAFNPLEAHEFLRPWIRGYHLSDNDGSADTNSKLKLDSWFWDVLKPDVGYYTLEVYDNNISSLVEHYKFSVNALNAALLKNAK